MPVHCPRTQAPAEADQKRIDAWDNGNLNIWWLSLAKWLEGHTSH
jgi:hypothetical protein